MPFNNPVVSAGGSIVRNNEKSPNFVHGSSGWSINKDGTAEFQQLTARGTITASEFDGINFYIASNGMFFYT